MTPTLDKRSSVILIYTVALNVTLSSSANIIRPLSYSTANLHHANLEIYVFGPPPPRTQHSTWNHTVFVHQSLSQRRSPGPSIPKECPHSRKSLCCPDTIDTNITFLNASLCGGHCMNYFPYKNLSIPPTLQRKSCYPPFLD